MSGHTPRPWYCDKTRFDACRILSDQDLDPFVPTVVGAAYIDGGCTKDEMEANARLIAAAPDLLEVCEELLPFLSELPETPTGTWFKLRMAIAKATGQDNG